MGGAVLLDGSSDLVCDVDYASWGANPASNPKMNKTGVSIDGPDAGAVTSAYNADTAPAEPDHPQHHAQQAQLLPTSSWW